MCKDLVVRIGEVGNPEKRTGNPVRFGGRRYLNTWYTYSVFRSWCPPEMMEKLYSARVCTRRRKRALYERVRSVYYRDGMFYRSKSNKNEQRTGDIFLIEPIDGEIWTCKPVYQGKNGLPDARITCVEGHPVSVTVDGESFDVTADNWQMIASFLGLDEHYKPAKWWPENMEA